MRLFPDMSNSLMFSQTFHNHTSSTSKYDSCFSLLSALFNPTNHEQTHVSLAVSFEFVFTNWNQLIIQNMAFSLLTSNGLPLFVEIGINWSCYVSALQEIYPTSYSYPITFENLTNGFKAILSYMGETTEIFTYTSDGILETVSLALDGDEYFTITYE